MTTTNYEPGRIYSGVVNGERQLMLCATTGFFINAEDTCAASQVTDVRGPLVVLDIPVDDAEALVNTLRRASWPVYADEIEQQTRPPLQIGWHEVTDNVDGQKEVMRWDGARFYWPAGHHSRGQWTSSHFIGPAGDDA